jgi:MOSC domain-containing protein YiiM
MRTFEQLESLWQAARRSPGGAGALRLIVLRREAGVHETPPRAALSCERGLVGDRWEKGSSPDSGRQITLINALAAELIVDGGPLDLPGDNLVVDLDLSDEALPAGTQLQIGTALLEVTSLPHTGCQKFSARFGADALRWVNWKEHRNRRLRGINCRVVGAGEVGVGDVCRVVS